MKRQFNIFLLLSAMAVSAITSTSCKESDYGPNWDDPSNYNALVTVKTTEDGRYFFQLTDSTAVFPRNFKEKITEETRALCRLYYDNDNFNSADTSDVDVAIFRKVLTKNAVTTDESTTIIARQDPVEIVDDWTTVCEDGYLTLHFVTQWGSYGTPHILNLVKISDTPLVFRFCHDKNGDFGTSWGDSIVSFRIADYLTETEEKYGTFTLAWLSTSGEKSVTFKYLAKH